jgi:hypothetical protein
MSDRAEVCPLSRGIMLSTSRAHSRGSKTQPLSAPLQRGIRFLRSPLPAGPSACLAACFPWLDLREPGGPSGLPRSVQVPAWVRFRLSAGGSISAIGDRIAPMPDPLPFWPKPVSPCGACQHLWLVFNDDVYQRFTYINHTTQSEPPTALMLAVATSPYDFVTIPRDEGYTCPQSFTPHRYQRRMSG